MHAIKETGNNLLAAFDPHDSVGILDKYFPCADFFTEFERFERHCEKLRRKGVKIDFVTVCSPNYLHDAHIRFGFRIGADVICEKPLVLNPWNVDALVEMEKETGKRVFTLMQLRSHPEIRALRDHLIKSQDSSVNKVTVKYVTPRGSWYFHSWKGNIDKSGGVATNIGVHFFDLLLWLFGKVILSEVHEHNAYRASGKLKFEKANVEWMISIKNESSGEKHSRLFSVNGKEIDLGHTEDLHLSAYREILDGQGIRTSEMKDLTSLLHSLRNVSFP